MNLKFPVRYLSGGDPVFGPNNGGAVVNTNIRAGYAWRWRAWLQRFPRVPTMINTLPYTPRWARYGQVPQVAEKPALFRNQA